MNRLLPTFIVNLKSEADRRTHILMELSKYEGMLTEIVDAVDGRNAPLETLAQFVAPSDVLVHHCRMHSLVPTEIACALSHLRCLRRMVDFSFPVSLILEDDVLLQDNFGAIARESAFFLQSLSTPAILLCSARTRVFGRRIRTMQDVAVYRALDGVGAYAYLVNLPAANLLLRKTLPLVAPFDHWFWHRKNGVALYSIVPHAASFSGAGDNSAIREQREEAWQQELTLRKNAERLRFVLNLDRRRIEWAFCKCFLGGRETTKEWPNAVL